jgi:hypothetical protein
MNRPLFRSAIATVIACACAPGFAEDFRALVAGVVTVSAENAEGTRIAMGFDESVAVLLPKDSPFVQGIEIEIRSPPAAIGAPGGFAYELWRRVDPAPEAKRFAYKGERIIMQPLPARAGYAIQIPVRADHGLKNGPYATLIPAIVEPRDFPFLFRLVPVSKGVTEAAEASKFQVRIRPLLGEEGELSLKLRYPEPGGERFPVAVTVDDRKVDPSSPILLKSGAHKLLVSSEAYRDEVRNFAVEQGRTLELSIELQDTTPILVVEAPDSAVVAIDGLKIDHVARPSMTVEPGEHNATCRIGDYSLSRRFTAYRGKSYKLVLEIDLQVQESSE